jgi:hypothetical protein
MNGETRQYRISLPKELVEAVDELVGPRKRSTFIAEAIEYRLQQRERFSKARAESTGVLADADYPEWETPEMTSAWVRELRTYDNEAFERKLKRWNLIEAESDGGGH